MGKAAGQDGWNIQVKVSPTQVHVVIVHPVTQPHLIKMLRDVGSGREAELLHPLQQALVPLAARHPQKVPRRLRQLEDVADVDDVPELEVELRREAARQGFLVDDLGEADLVPSKVVVLVEELGRQFVVYQRAAGEKPDKDLLDIIRLANDHDSISEAICLAKIVTISHLLQYL